MEKNWPGTKKMVVVVAISIITIAILFIGTALPDTKYTDYNKIFHVTLADPQLYNDNGVFSADFTLEPKGKKQYQFRFTPNGDSPKTLSITIESKDKAITLFKEDFKLKGTLHNTGISEYHTWEYLGEKVLPVDDMQLPQIVQITINPNGNLLGPVSVSLIVEE